MKMNSLNKNLICLNSKYCLFNQHNKLNIISTKLQKPVFSSINILKSFSVSNRLTQNSIKIRRLSTNTTQRVPNEEPIKRSATITKQSFKEITDKINGKTKTPAVESIGIVGIHKWEDLKNVRQWICVYHFPYITHLRTFQRLKLWLTVINCSAVPLSIILYSSGFVLLDTIINSSLLSMFSLFAMYIFGHLFSRFVGRIYVSDDGSYVRLSHLSFFGKRVNTDFEREDVVPLMETNFKLNDWYCGIERYSASNQLYMSLKFGGITNKEAFEQVFGEDSTKFLIKK